MSLKFTGTYEELKQKLNSLTGTWDNSQSGKKSPSLKWRGDELV